MTIPPKDVYFPYTGDVGLDFMNKLTSDFRVAWDELRFGNSYARGYMGWTAAIDQAFASSPCTGNQSLTSVRCLSLNGLVDDLVLNGEKNIREKAGMSPAEIFAAVRRSYQVSQQFYSKLANTTEQFLAVTSLNCGLGFPTLALYIPVFFVMLVLSAFLFNEMDTYLNISQQIRSMFLLIPFDAAEAVPEIREYVNTLATKNSLLSFLKREKDSDKKTKAILEGSSDGVILCNSEGNIVEVNNAAQAMFCITQADVVGNSLSTLFNEDLSLLIREVSRTHKGTKKELYGKRNKTDTQFPVRLSTRYIIIRILTQD
jgi:PAS domain S-box-containing protein